VHCQTEACQRTEDGQEEAMEQTSHTYTSKNKAQQTSNSMPFVHILHDSDSGQIQKEEIPIFTLTATNNWVNN